MGTNNEVKLKGYARFKPMQQELLKLKADNEVLLNALKKARTEIIRLTDSDQKANKVYYPKYIDEAIKKAEAK